MNNTEIVERMKSFQVSREFVFNVKQNRWITYGMIFSTARELKKTVETEEIIICAENDVSLLIMYFMCMVYGIKMILIDPQKSEMEINSIISNHKEIPIFRNQDIQHEIVEKEMTNKEYLEMIEMIELEKEYMVTYTSGSSGIPKGVIHTLKNLFWSAVDFSELVEYNEKSIVCHTMPMTYMAGILNTIFLPFIMGSKIALFPRFDVMCAVTFWKNVEKYGVNTFWLSPTMLNILMTVDRKGKAKEYLTNRETTFCIGTAPLFKETKEKFEDRYGVKLLASYGLSETLFISTVTKDMPEDVNTVGKLLPGVDMHFSKDKEIYIRVPWMYKGYINENTDQYFDGECYLSGDLGELHDKKLYITGRKKDLIIRGGLNISPKQIENVINKSSEIRECVVTSIIEKEEERIVCVYVSEKDIDLASELNDDIKTFLGVKYKVDYFKKIKSIPKNLNGKIDKQKVKEEFIQGDN